MGDPCDVPLRAGATRWVQVASAAMARSLTGATGGATRIASGPGSCPAVRQRPVDLGRAEAAYPVPMKAWTVVAVVGLMAFAGCSYQAQSRAAGWALVETEHIRLRTNLSSRRAIAIAREMQRLRDVLAGNVVRCPVIAPDDRFPVTVLSSSEYEEIARTGSGAFTRHMGLTWLPDYETQIVMPADILRDVRQDFQHELTHHLLAMCLPRAPLWLNEGMAKLVETAVVDRDVVLIGLPPFALTQGDSQPELRHFRGVEVMVLPRSLLPSVDEVVAMTDTLVGERGAHDELRSAGRYAGAWALLHLLMIGDPEQQPRLVAFLGELARSKEDPAALFEKHFAGVALQEKLDRYVLDGLFRYARRPVRAARRGAPRVRAMTAGEANLHLAWLWSGATDKADAEARRREHQAAALADPSSRGEAHTMAAVVRLASSRDFAAAEREIDEGLRVAPSDATLLHAKVDLVLHRKGDATEIAGRLREVARTASQMCAVARVELAAGRLQAAVQLARAALKRRPSAWDCREVLDEAGGLVSDARS